MPAGTTYSTIATTTLGSATPSYTFSSIPQTYTALVLIGVNATTSTTTIFMRFNSDSGNNYSYTQMWGPNGSVPYTERQSNVNHINLHSSTATIGDSMFTADIMNYSGTSMNKTVLVKARDGQNSRRYIDAEVWRNTSAITSITLLADVNNMAAGTTLTLYGIAAA